MRHSHGFRRRRTGEPVGYRLPAAVTYQMDKDLYGLRMS
jgi:hypothetical protein